jgi:hypothetical protein
LALFLSIAASRKILWLESSLPSAEPQIPPVVITAQIDHGKRLDIDVPEG